MKPFFLVLEGIDGAGKTTQAQLLRRYYQRRGWKVVLFREPGSTALGEKLRRLLLTFRGRMSPVTELFLYLAARRQLVEEKLLPLYPPQAPSRRKFKIHALESERSIPFCPSREPAPSPAKGEGWGEGCPSRGRRSAVAESGNPSSRISNPGSTPTLILFDRFYPSTVAYQGITCRLDIPTLLNLNFLAIQQAEPDLVVILDIPPRRALGQIKRRKDRIERRGLAFYREVRQVFLTLARHEPERFAVIPSAGLSNEELRRRITARVDQAMNSGQWIGDGG